MNILLVMNDYEGDNAFSAPVRETVNELRRMGLRIGVLTGSSRTDRDEQENGDLFALPFGRTVRIRAGRGEERYRLALVDPDRVSRAVAWADLVHIEEAGKLCTQAARAAAARDLPVTGSFRLYPESIRDLAHFGRTMNGMHMEQYRDYTYSYCEAIRCPSEHVYRRLKHYNFESRLAVMEGGISTEVLVESEKPFVYDEPYLADPAPLVQMFAGGDIPVIADYPSSAAAEYALTPRNRYAPGQDRRRDRCLRYWAQQEGERKAISLLYRQKAMQLSSRNLARRLLGMMRDVYYGRG